MLRTRLRVLPDSLPKARKCGIWIVTCSVHTPFAESGRDFEEQRCLANLSRTSKELDSTRGCFIEPAEQQLPARSERILNLRHN